MNIQTSPYAVNSHLIETQFNTNQRIFANCIARELATLIKKDLENDFSTPDYIAPNYSDQEMWSLNLDITNKVGLVAVGSLSKPCEYLPPFYNWMEKISKGCNTLEKWEVEHIQDKMDTVGILARQKLTELFALYTFHPMRESFRIHAGYDKVHHELQVKFWMNSSKL